MRAGAFQTHRRELADAIAEVSSPKKQTGRHWGRPA